MNNYDSKEILEFLLKADFEHANYGYNELYQFCRFFQQSYKDIYLKNMKMFEMINQHDKKIQELIIKIEELEKINSYNDIQITNLSLRLSKKLTPLERLKGKLIL